MKTKAEIYRATEELVSKTIKAEYMKYLRTARNAWSDRTLLSDEVDKIVSKAYLDYKDRERELEDILDHAYLDYMN